MTTVAPVTPLGRFIARRRKAVKKRVVDLAREMGVRAPTICAWESGKARPGIERLPRLAEALCCHVTELTSRASRGLPSKDAA